MNHLHLQTMKKMKKDGGNLKDEILKVCSNCFEEKCNCKSNKIEIDKNIYPIIKTLNQKGYHTKFCCEGHIYNKIFDLYIYFDKKYLFNNYPKFFKIENFREGIILRCLDVNDNPNYEKRKILKKSALKELEKWSINLKSQL